MEAEKKRERKIRNAIRHMQRHNQFTVAGCWRAWARREEIAEENQKLARKGREHDEMESNLQRKNQAFEQ